MNRLLPALLIVAALAAAGAAFALRGGSTPSPTPANDLRAVFMAGPAEHRQTDARTLAAIAGLAASVVEADGTKQEPALATAGAVDALRGDLRALALNGLSFRDRYPASPEWLGTFFKNRVGAEDGPLDETKRKKWVDAFRALRDEASTVADSF